jgi:autotransporter-associated beta strand protein
MGIIVVKGGTFSCGNLMMCPNSNGDAWMIHRGGSVSITGSSHLSGESANHLNIYSGYILDAQGCTSTITSHYLGYATNATTHLVVHEGIMSMNNCFRSGPADNGATVYVALDGGTMQARQTVDNFFGATSKPIEHVTVYPRGITFDTQSYAITIPTVLAGPTGKGVAAIPMTAEVSAAGKFIGTPLVVITGDGQGAVAYCDYDSDTKTVNSIRVVSPGWGYTTATASIYRGGMKIGTKIDLPCTLTEGDLAGGDFIKTGSGTLTISGANTWLGDLVVSNGTVKLGAAAALPATAAAHVRAGATLNMNGQAFNGLLGTGGGTVSGNVAGAKGWKVRVADLGTTLQVTGTLSFAAGATLTVDDPAQLAEGKYTLVTATGGISGDLPTVSVPREYGRWQLLQVNNSLVFCPLKGMTISVR